jgi:glucosamine--fructose-6-phosphate aminotransferase (isomerizing)
MHFPQERYSFVIYMLSEIREQPQAFARIVGEEWETAVSIAKHARTRGVRFAIIAARGSSDNAAIFGKYLLEIQNGIPVSLASPSAFGLYEARMDLSGVLVIGISQSGEAPDVVEVMARAREMGALTVAITNTPGSPLASASEHVILCRAGEEKSVAATKTYMNSIGALYLLSAALGGRDSNLLDYVRRLPEQMEQVLNLESEIAGKVERYRYMEECVVLSRGLNLCTAFETALKLTETCYIVAKPYSASDFLHGPIAMVEQGFPCLLFAADGPCMPGLLELCANLRERGAELVVFSSNQKLLESATTKFPIPENLPEVATPPIYVIAGQLFSCYLSLTRGLDPDHPRGLKKVTRTR